MWALWPKRAHLGKQSDLVVMNGAFVLLQLEIEDFVPGLLYFGYTCIMVLSFWLLTGTVGFYATYIFIRHIYAAVKID